MVSTKLTKLLGFAVGLLFVAAGFWYVSNSGTAAVWYRQLTTVLAPQEQVASETSDSSQTPEPLRGPREERAAYQTIAGVIAETNKHRATEGLAPLSMNTRLNASAKAKLDDLFARQYFAHSAPTGEGPSDLIQEAGYEYITVAENLALGNYATDAVLVQAWMDSPGHRANIMNGSFEEIGVAVGQGVYEGSRVWIAVQHFGRPLSACPSVSGSLKASIDTRQTYLDGLTIEIEEREEELDELKGSNPTLYNQKVDEYNSVVEAYNRAAQRLKADLATYNAQVEAFNECVHSGA